MMHFSLQINGASVTEVRAVNKGQDPEDSPGWFMYDWVAYRVDPDDLIRQRIEGRLTHRRDDGIEALAEAILAEYRRLVRAREDVLT